ncbi:RHE_PE00001 family protein [Beijerinckia indica]|uniref:Uncharacterized protein n=1 Tax=Beijerinckia indica subsp. indica (strain ATCC 9039 / DSM 1715 / NCIMB 8712) TaxID=395963 RepID=B2ILC3_BEII9|nr:RHE_PE00001 family protein [Beijerinckia indica]ACB97323.1 protein of unknown function DUF1612 [Beijerinckia indica subsp. indica ATCC 9039]
MMDWQTLPWPQLIGPLIAAEDALARLDSRLAASPIRDGWIARMDVLEACASISLDGGLVDLADLVLRDANMDSAPSSEVLTRAEQVLAARRRIAKARPRWALSPEGLASLTGRSGDPERVSQTESRDGEGDREAGQGDETEEVWASPFAALDAAMARVTQRLAQVEAGLKPVLSATAADRVLAPWLAVQKTTEACPPTLAAAIAYEAWVDLRPLPQQDWLGRLLAASSLRCRGKTETHLVCFNVGLRALPPLLIRPKITADRLARTLDAFTAAARKGLVDHDRWLTARELFLRKTEGRRSTSHLAALVDLVLRRPVVSSDLIAKELKITPRAAQTLVATLGLRELTGRGRYRAWGIV